MSAERGSEERVSEERGGDRSRPEKRLRRATAAVTFVLVAGTSLVVWRHEQGQTFEGTLNDEELATWLVWTGAVSAAFLLAMLVFWRERPLRMGIVTGLPMALLVVVIGVGIDLVTSGGA